MNTPVRKCRICKQPFSGRSDRLYCSSKCKVIAWARRQKSSNRKHLTAVFLLLLFPVAAPSFTSAEVSTTLATYYTTHSCQIEGASGILTANGERFDESAMTCAAWGVPFQTRLRITNLDNNASIVCRVNDRGPGHAPRVRGVIVDLTIAAYDALGGKRGVNRRGIAWGEISVRVDPL